MSNSRHDEKATLVIPAETDFDRLERIIDRFDPADHSPYAICSAFFWYHQNRDVAPGEQLSAKEYRQALREDLHVIRERCRHPEKYARSTEDYTFGYGFEQLRVMDNLLLIGTYNEYNAGGSEVSSEDMEIIEYEVFSRWETLGLLPSADGQL